MLLSIHNLADAYKMLPSQILTQATTFDLFILDVHSRWLKYQEEVQEAKRQGREIPLQRQGLNQEQMQQMVAYAKGARRDKVKKNK